MQTPSDIPVNMPIPLIATPAQEATIEAVETLAEELREHRMVSEGPHGSFNYKTNRKKSKGDFEMGKVVMVPQTGMGYNGCMPGMGGWGGWGVPPVGMFGVMPWGNGMYGHGRHGDDGFRHHDGGRHFGDIERMMAMGFDGVNSRMSDTNDEVRTNRVTGAIGGVNDHLGHMSDRMFAKALSDLKCCCDQEKTTLLGFKDLQAQMLKCCCEEKEVTHVEACKTRETIACQEEKTREVIVCEAEKTRHAICEQTRLIERLECERKNTLIVDLKGENSNLRQTAEIKGAVHGNRDEFFAANCRLEKRIDDIECSIKSITQSVTQLASNVGHLASVIERMKDRDRN